MNELISVIVPVYNVENYLHRCIRSILEQSYKELEVLLIDDGSTDSSGIICDDWATKDNRIKVVHQTNQGLGPARNSGLNIAEGRYVAFVDSDDWIEQDMYETLYAKLKEYDCDVATCGRKVVTDERIVQYIYCHDSERLLEKEEAVKNFLLQKDINMSACDKLIKAELFGDIRFPGQHLVSEDMIPIYEIIKRANRVILTGKPFYNYYYRLGSLSKSSFNKKLMGAYYYSKEVATRVRKDFPTMAEEAEFFEIDFMLGVYRSLRDNRYSGEEKKLLLSAIKRRFGHALRNHYLYMRHKAYMFLAVLRIDRIPNLLYRQYKTKQIR